jgi:hypothetical protein
MGADRYSLVDAQKEAAKKLIQAKIEAAFPGDGHHMATLELRDSLMTLPIDFTKIEIAPAVPVAVEEGAE